jgi:uncharacterized membrane protein
VLVLPVLFLVVVALLGLLSVLLLACEPLHWWTIPGTLAVIVYTVLICLIAFFGDFLSFEWRVALFVVGTAIVVIVAIVFALSWLISWLRKPKQKTEVKRPLTEQQARQMIIDAINRGGIATNPHIVSMREHKGLWHCEGNATANSTTTHFRAEVDEKGNVDILGVPVCKACGQQMTLLDEENQKWYCYKDDEVLYLTYPS